MTVAGESIGSDRAVSKGRGAADRSALPVSAVVICAGIGVLASASDYTAGRLGQAGTSWADRLYWLGQLLPLVPMAARLLSRRVLTAGETLTLVVVLTVAEYLVKVCYNAAAFTYVDELIHWRSAANIMRTSKRERAVGEPGAGRGSRPDDVSAGARVGWWQVWRRYRRQPCAVALAMHNQDVSVAWNLTPADGQTWQRSVPFTGTYTLAANLYRLPGLAHPYRYGTTHGGKAI